MHSIESATSQGEKCVYVHDNHKFSNNKFVVESTFRKGEQCPHFAIGWQARESCGMSLAEFNCVAVKGASHY